MQTPTWEVYHHARVDPKTPDNSFSDVTEGEILIEVPFVKADPDLLRDMMMRARVQSRMNLRMIKSLTCRSGAHSARAARKWQPFTAEEIRTITDVGA